MKQMKRKRIDARRAVCRALTTIAVVAFLAGIIVELGAAGAADNGAEGYGWVTAGFAGVALMGGGWLCGRCAEELYDGE